MKIIVGDDTGLVKVVCPERNQVEAIWGTQALNANITHMCWTHPGVENEIVLAHKDGSIDARFANSGVLDFTIRDASSSTASTSSVANRQFKGLFSHIDSNDRIKIVTCTPDGKVQIRAFNANLITRSHSSPQNDEEEKEEKSKTASTLNLIACSNSDIESTSKQISRNNGEITIEMNQFTVAAPVESMKYFEKSTSQIEISVGGKNNHLHIYDLETQKVTFKARNLSHDWLDMQRPVWIKDSVFLDENCIATCTAFHTIQLYDRRERTFRPSVDKEFGENPFIFITKANDDHNVIAGNSLGSMVRMDLRNLKHIMAYKGSAGSIHTIACHPLADIRNSDPDTCLVASSGADRWVHVHNLRNCQGMFNVYVKQRINCMLFLREGKRLPPEQEEQEQEDNKLWSELPKAEDDAKRKRSRPDDSSPTAAASTRPTKSVRFLLDENHHDEPDHGKRSVQDTDEEDEEEDDGMMLPMSFGSMYSKIRRQVALSKALARHSGLFWRRR